MVKIVKQDFEENKRRYNKLVEKLKIKLPNEVQITHIGSTAIPNMYGKKYSRHSNRCKRYKSI